MIFQKRPVVKVSRAQVVIGRAKPKDEKSSKIAFISRPKPPADVVHVLRREPVKYRDEDLSKFVLSVFVSDAPCDYFCTPEEKWWANGRDDQEWLAETFRLFDSVEDIQAALQTDVNVLANTLYLNIYSLELINGEIAFNWEQSLYPDSE